MQYYLYCIVLCLREHLTKNQPNWSKHAELLFDIYYIINLLSFFKTQCALYFIVYTFSNITLTSIITMVNRRLITASRATINMMYSVYGRDIGGRKTTNKKNKTERDRERKRIYFLLGLYMCLFYINYINVLI